MNTSQRRGIDDFVFASSAQTKVASASPEGSSFLAKLASELSGAVDPCTGSEVVDASGNSVAGVAPEIWANTAASHDKAVTLAGGDTARQDAGDARSRTVAQTPTVSDGTGEVDQNLAIVNQFANTAGLNQMSPEKVASLLDGAHVGRVIAQGYAAELASMAKEAALQDAVAYLRPTGVLDGYAFLNQEETTKTASAYDGLVALEKVAGCSEAITDDDIIAAAAELRKIASEESAAEAEKVASDAAADAEFLCTEIAKIASELAYELVGELASGNEKVASADNEALVRAAFDKLVSAGIITA